MLLEVPVRRAKKPKMRLGKPPSLGYDFGYNYGAISCGGKDAQTKDTQRNQETF